MNIQFETDPGDNFHDVARKCKVIAENKNAIVEFEFNRVLCLVKGDTVLDWLWKYYSDAHIMDWKTIGPDYRMEYDEDIKIELYTRRLEQAKRQKEANENRRKKDQAEREAAEKKTKGVTLLIHPDKQSEYESYVIKNSSDGYSRAVIDYAETWARIMQVEIAAGKTNIKDIADECQKGLGYLGITGFQYGCAVGALSRFWVFGEELRRWHNNEYGVAEDQKGVVNPAVLTLKS